jgi:hypothetical protein
MTCHGGTHEMGRRIGRLCFRDENFFYYSSNSLRGYCVSTLVFNLNCDFAPTFFTLHFYPYCSNTNAPFTPICDSVTCDWVKKISKTRKDTRKYKSTHYPYLNSSLQSTLPNQPFSLCP